MISTTCTEERFFQHSEARENLAPNNLWGRSHWWISYDYRAQKQSQRKYAKNHDFNYKIYSRRLRAAF